MSPCLCVKNVISVRGVGVLYSGERQRRQRATFFPALWKFSISDEQHVSRKSPLPTKTFAISPSSHGKRGREEEEEDGRREREERGKERLISCMPFPSPTPPRPTGRRGSTNLRQAGGRDGWMNEGRGRSPRPPTAAACNCGPPPPSPSSPQSHCGMPVVRRALSCAHPGWAGGIKAINKKNSKLDQWSVVKYKVGIETHPSIAIDAA